MTTGKKKPKIQASEIAVGSRTLEGVLLDLAEQTKLNAERSARAEERSAFAEERAAIALQTIAAVSRDLQAITQEMRASAVRAEGRLDALEKAAGA